MTFSQNIFFTNMFLQDIFTPYYPIKIGETQFLGDEIHIPDVGKKVKFAVNMRHCYKTYGMLRGKFTALDDFTMEVPEGEIICLLGIEGRGKRTAMSVLIDRTRVDEGFVKVLGYPPGHSKTRNKIGYMPPRTALPIQLTVKEVMLDYGTLCGMDKDEIMNRYRFLHPFLELPSGDILVKNLNMGEKKIVSFAVAVIHDPELLILDEPTTDLDLMPRRSVRRYIKRIVKFNKRTVVYTARFVEDTKWCSLIGLVGDGFMIEQGLVQDLLDKYDAQHVYQLQKRVLAEVRGVAEQEIIEQAASSEKKPQKRSSKILVSKKNKTGRNIKLKLQKWKKLYLSKDYKCMNCNVFFTLVKMGLKRILRNFALLSILVFLPILQALVFGFAFGSEPKGIIVAIANDEVKLNTDKYKSCTNKNETCDAARFSCWLLDDLDKNSEVKICKDKDEAHNMIKKAEALVGVIIDKTFSSILRGQFAKNGSSSQKSPVEVYLDGSDTFLALVFKQTLEESYTKLLKSAGKLCSASGVEKNVFPIYYYPPVYGSFNTRFSISLSTGLHASMIFYMAVILSSTMLIHEKNSGIFNRLCCSGIYPSQMLMIHYVVLYIVMAIQSLILFSLLTFGFGMPDGGNFPLMVSIGTLIACTGISCGVIISCLCSTERMASIITMGSFYPVIMISGILWPLECAPSWFRILSLFSPLTHPTAALRAIKARKWGIEHDVVRNGIIWQVVWIVMCYLISLIFIKRNRG